MLTLRFDGNLTELEPLTGHHIGDSLPQSGISLYCGSLNQGFVLYTLLKVGSAKKCLSLYIRNNFRYIADCCVGVPL